MYSVEDIDELGVNAPKPLDASSVEEAELQTLAQGEGAVSARRGGHRDTLREVGQSTEDMSGIALSMPRRTLIALIVAAAVVIVASISLFAWVLTAPDQGASQVAPMRIQAATDESVSCRDVSYSLKEQNGFYSLMETRSDESGSAVAVGELRGTPVCIVLFDGSVVLPENLSDGTWDIAAYAVGTGCGYLSNQSGEAYKGQGTITEATLDGSTLRLVVDGQPVEVPLEW